MKKLAWSSKQVGTVTCNAQQIIANMDIVLAGVNFASHFSTSKTPGTVIFAAVSYLAITQTSLVYMLIHDIQGTNPFVLHWLPGFVCDGSALWTDWSVDKIISNPVKWLLGVFNIHLANFNGWMDNMLNWLFSFNWVSGLPVISDNSQSLTETVNGYAIDYHHARYTQTAAPVIQR